MRRQTRYGTSHLGHIPAGCRCLAVRGRYRKRLLAYLIVTLGLGLAAVFVVAQTDLITFKPGDVIKASEVNQNFQNLLNAITGKQNAITERCEFGSAIRVVNEDGTVECEADDVGEGGGGGDITEVVAGGGSSGGGTSGSVTLSVDPTQTQARVIGNCEAGQSSREIN